MFAVGTRDLPEGVMSPSEYERREEAALLGAVIPPSGTSCEPVTTRLAAITTPLEVLATMEPTGRTIPGEERTWSVPEMRGPARIEDPTWTWVCLIFGSELAMGAFFTILNVWLCGK